LVRRGGLQTNLVEIDLELLGDQHRDRGVGALTHLDIGHCQHDASVFADPHERVGHEAIAVGRRRAARA
jgi:hypothetical protein